MHYWGCMTVSTKFECNNFRINTEISMQTNKELTASFVIDTGAVATTMSINSLSRLTHYSEDIIRSFIKDKNGKYYKGITGAMIKSVPIILRGVLIGDMKLDEFRVMISDEQTHVNVIGMDFLTATVSILAEDKCLEVTGWTSKKYRDNWYKILNGMELYEINSLQQESKVASLLKQAKG